MRVQSLGREDTLVEGMATHFSMNLGKLQETVRGREAWRAVVHVAADGWTRFSD